MNTNSNAIMLRKRFLLLGTLCLLVVSPFGWAGREIPDVVWAPENPTPDTFDGLRATYDSVLRSLKTQMCERFSWGKPFKPELYAAFIGFCEENLEELSAAASEVVLLKPKDKLAPGIYISKLDYFHPQAITPTARLYRKGSLLSLRWSFIDTDHSVYDSSILSQHDVLYLLRSPFKLLIVVAGKSVETPLSSVPNLMPTEVPKPLPPVKKEAPKKESKDNKKKNDSHPGKSQRDIPDDDDWKLPLPQESENTTYELEPKDAPIKKLTTVPRPPSFFRARLNDKMWVANTGPYPARIEGAALQAAGGIGVLKMRLDPTFGGKQQADVIEPKSMEFRWSYYNVTSLVKQGLSAQAIYQRMMKKPAADFEEVGRWASTRRDLATQLDDLFEDEKTAGKDLVRGRETEGWFRSSVNRVASALNLILVPASWIKEAGGTLIGGLGTVFGEDHDDREIAWPHEEGFYFVRCFATPKIKGSLKRAASVAGKIVEVRTPAYLALNALDESEARLDELRLAASLEADPQKQVVLQKALDELDAQIHDNAVEVLETALAKKQAELKKVQAEEARELLKSQIDVLQKQAKRARENIKDSWGPGIHRPQAAFSSQVTGETYSLLLQLHRLYAPKSEWVHWKLSDVSSLDGKSYEGKGINDQEAVWDAFQKLAGDNPYGRGYFAIRLLIHPDLSNVSQKTAVLRSANRELALVKKRLGDLVVCLSLISPWSRVAGEVAMFVGGALAAERLVSRFQQGGLSIDTASVSDIISVLGAAGSGLVHARNLQLRITTNGRFLLANRAASVAELEVALSELRKADDVMYRLATTNGAVSKIGLFWGNLVVINTLADVTKEETEGRIPHSTARRQRVYALLGGLQSNLLYIHGMRQAERIKVEQESRYASEARMSRYQMKELMPSPRELLPAASENAVGGVRGNDIYKVGGTPQIATGSETFEANIQRAKITTVASRTELQLVSRGDAVKSSIYKLLLEHTQTPLEASIAIRAENSLRKAVFPDQIVAHGNEAGPARLVLKAIDSANKWAAEILVRPGVRPDDLTHIVQHELNELAYAMQLVPKNMLVHEIQAFVQNQMEAGMFHKQGDQLEPTAHDYAAAHELFGFVENWYLVSQESSPDEKAITSARARVERMLVEMGLERVPSSGVADNKNALIQRKVRLDTLLKMSQDWLQRKYPPGSNTQTGLARRLRELQQSLQPRIEMDAAKARKADDFAFSEKTVRHILYPEDTGSEFHRMGIGGGHLDSELMIFQQENPQYWLELIEVKQIKLPTGRQVEMKTYHQWKHKSGVPPPLEQRPGGAAFLKNDWMIAAAYDENKKEMKEIKKTTLSDGEVLLEQGESAFEKWNPKSKTEKSQEPEKQVAAGDKEISTKSPESIAANDKEISTKSPEPIAGSNVEWNTLSKDGIDFSGWAYFDSIKNNWIPTTSYPKAAK